MRLLDVTPELALELARPGALVWVAVAIVVWWILARTPRVSEVASTFLWQRVARGGLGGWQTRWLLLAVLVLATLALARIGVHAEEAVPALKSTLQDENRYVRGQAVHALYRTGTPEAKDILIEHLMTSRWCHSTTKESTH